MEGGSVAGMEASPSSQPATTAGLGSDPGFDPSSLHALADALPAAVFVFEGDRNIYVNSAAAALTGFTVVELEGMAFWEVVDPEWRDRIRLNGEARQRGETVPSSYEVPLRRRDGGRCWVQFTGRRVLYGDRPAILGIAFDVTRRRADEDHYRSLFENCPDAVFEKDFSGVRRCLDSLHAAGVRDFEAHFRAHPEVAVACAESIRMTDVNSAALQLYGASTKQELEGRLSRMLTTGTAIDLWRRELVAWASGATMFEGETASTTLAGDPIHVWVHCSVAPGYETSLAKVFVSVKDVTRERWSAAALRDSEERYRTLYENMPAMYFTLDPAGTVLAVNEFGAGQLGYEPAALIGQPVLAIFHPDDRNAVLQRMEDANRAAGRVEPWELRKVRRDGSIIWVRETVRRLADSGNLLVLCEDVTERRALEERILSISECERERVAEDLHDDLGQRLSGLAYLVRALQLRLQDAAHPEAGLANEIAGHADDALARLRALSHVMSALEVPERGLVPSLQMLAEVIASIHGIECQVRCDPRVQFDEPTCASDLYRIVQEALTNAVRHGQAKHIEISLALREGRTVLHVHDDGRGPTAGDRDPEGMGLKTMRYRATRLGATLTAGAATGGGFEVVVTLPDLLAPPAS